MLRRLFRRAAAALLLPALIAISPAPAADGDALFLSGHFEEAQAAFAARLQSNPNDTGALLGTARVDLYGNDLRAATRSANRLLAVQPGNAEATRLLQTIAARNALYAQASHLQVPNGGVAIPFLETDPLPLIGLTIQGRSAGCVLDTGAPDVVVDPAFAQRAGLKISGGREGVFAGGRTAIVRHAHVDRIQAGSLTLRDIDADVLPSPPTLYRDRSIDCVVGTRFLERFLATIDYPNHRLLLQPRAASAVKGGTTMPMWLVGDHFIFALGSVNDLSNVLFLVDSGLAGGGFSPEQPTIDAAHVQTFPNEAGRGFGGGGEVSFIPVLARRVCLATVCQPDIRGVYSPGGSPLAVFPFHAAGVVSHTFLEHYAVTFDFARMTLTLRPPN